MAIVKLDLLVGALDKADPVLTSLEGKLRRMDDAAAQFNEKWARVSQLSQQAGAALSAGGAVIVGGMLAAAKQASDLGSQLNDMSLATGASVEMLSELHYAAKQTGADLGTVAMAFKFVGRNASEAMNGNAAKAEVFERLGVAVRNADGSMRSAEEIFADTAAAIRQVGNENMRTSYAMELFGRSGVAMLPMIMDAKGGVAGLRAEARQLGLTMSKESAAGADAFGDSLQQLKDTAGRAFVDLGIAAMPVLQSMIDMLTKGAVWLRRFSDEHPVLTKVLISAVAAVGLFSATLGPVLMALPGAIALWNGLTVAMGRNAAAATEAAAANTAAGAAATRGAAGGAATGVLGGAARSAGIAGGVLDLGLRHLGQGRDILQQESFGGQLGAIGRGVLDNATFGLYGKVRGLFGGGGAEPTRHEHVHRLSSDGETARVLLGNPEAQAAIKRAIRGERFALGG